MILWRPDPHLVETCNLTRFLRFLADRHGLRFKEYRDLYEWSITELENFWDAAAAFFEIRFHAPPEKVLSGRTPGEAHWFPGATLNYAEYLLDKIRQHSQDVLILSAREGQSKSERRRITGEELLEQIARAANALRNSGVGKGDRVCGYLPNCPETVIAFLAAASIGAIWSSCPPELASKGVIDRLQQIQPKVLFGVTGYFYGGKRHDRTEALRQVAQALPSLKTLVLVGDDPAPDLLPATAATISFPDFLRRADTGSFSVLPVEFEHPLWILFSSGTTGIPKPIVQSHGGILLEHLKALSLHLNLGPGDRFFWFTTAGWMMWNFLVSGLGLGCCIVLYDGSPKHPDLSVLWRFVDEEGIGYFGTSAPFLSACQKAGVSPGRDFRLGALKAIGSTAAPLPPDGFDWVYRNVKSDVWLGSASGGTDVCTAFILSNPLEPVIRGKLQCRGLGARIESWNENGEAVWNKVGELVLTAPFPSMPVFFWNDKDGQRFKASYFDYFPGIWRHGDWIEIDPATGQCVIYGRSDSTLNRGGVRIGTSEFYSVVETFPEITEALVIDTTGLGERDGKLILFVVPAPAVTLSAPLKAEMKNRIRSLLSPRYVPDDICTVSSIPYTLNGKKLEVPIKRLFQGVPLDKAVSREAVGNPEALTEFVNLACEALGAVQRNTCE